MINFKLIQEKQRELDSKINNCRERDIDDMSISFIAELVEWQETTEFSHKTWKHSNYTRAEQFEEYTDMLFFIVQIYNSNGIEIDLEKINKDPDYTRIKNMDGFNEKQCFKLLMINILFCNIEKTTIQELLISYLILAECMGYTEQELENEYLRKHKINLERIEKSRENGGWKH